MVNLLKLQWVRIFAAHHLGANDAVHNFILIKNDGM